MIVRLQDRLLWNYNYETLYIMFIQLLWLYYDSTMICVLIVAYYETTTMKRSSWKNMEEGPSKILRLWQGGLVKFYASGRGGTSNVSPPRAKIPEFWTDFGYESTSWN